MPTPPFLYPVPRLTHPTYPPPAALRLRHRYRRDRPGDLHRPVGRCGPGYGGHGATVFASCSKRLGQRGVMDAFVEDEES